MSSRLETTQSPNWVYQDTKRESETNPVFRHLTIELLLGMRRNMKNANCYFASTNIDQPSKPTFDIRHNKTWFPLNRNGIVKS